jgi:Fe-S cluster assembly iron-binding protein IscA
MIEVTEKAATELKTLLEQEGKPELALRIFCCWSSLQWSTVRTGPRR